MESWIRKCSKSILKFTDCNESYCEDEENIVSVEMVIYDSITFFVTLSIGLLSNHLIQTVLYIVLFTTIRRYCGGYHADTHVKCFLYYISLYVIFLLALRIQFIWTLVFGFVSFSYVYSTTPVQHIHQPLSQEDYIKNKRSGRRIILGLFLLNLILVFSNYLVLYKVINLVMIWISVLMVIQRHCRYYRRSI